MRRGDGLENLFRFLTDGAYPMFDKGNYTSVIWFPIKNKKRKKKLNC